ncbi:unnamed protein product, partial [Rotaria magnacalcarata]
MALSNQESYAFKLTDIVEEPERMLPPIQGYEKMPLVTLEEAVKPLIETVPEVERMVFTVMPNCQNPPDGLSPDESASIMIYSLEWGPPETPFYKILNKILRGGDRDLLRPWFLYLKLVLTALSKIPSKRLVLHRGVKQDFSASYHQGGIIVWWGFSSCTSSIHVLQNEAFLGKTGTRTLFSIDCHSGKDIQGHSMYKNENEILLLAARQFKVISILNTGNDLHIVHIEEIDPLTPLLAPPSASIAFTSPKSSLWTSSIKPQSSDHDQNAKLEQIISKCQSDKINLKGQRLNDQGMEIVVKHGIIGKQCRRLDLMNSEVTPGSVSILVDALRNNTCLEELNITHNSISDSDIRLLASVANSSILKRIDLEDNDISDDGARYLADMLETNTKLLRLSLSVNHISSRGVNMLANALTSSNTHLEFLNLSANTDVNDESIDSVVNMMEHNRSLKKLDLRHCDLSDDGKTKSVTNESDSSYELGVAYTGLCQHVGCSWTEADGIIQWVCCCDQHLCNTGIPLPISTTTVTSGVSTRIRANKKQRQQYGPSIIHSSSRISPLNTSMKTPTNLLMTSDASKLQEIFQTTSFSFDTKLSTETISKHLRTENIEKKKIYPKKWLIVIIVITILFALSALAVGIYLIIHFTTKKTTTTPTLKPLLRWNSTGLTVADVGGSSGSTSDKLNTPIDLAMDFSNTLYIADFNNNRIQQWLTGALNGAAYLNAPAGVFIDSNNNIYISDSTNARIQEWTSGATSGTRIAGTGSSGYAYNQFDTPYFISRDITTNTLYIADYNNHRAMSYASGASNGTLVIGGQGPGINNTQLYYPVGVYFDSASNCLLIANYGGQHIVRWTLGDSNWALVAGTPGMVGSSSTLLSYPTGVTLDPMGNLYVADTGNHRLQRFLAGQNNGTTIT